LVGLVAGVVGRALMPGDPFRHTSGPASWGVSILVGLAGAVVGYVIFTIGLGIGDTDAFDWGGILSAIIGVFIVLAIVGWVMRRRQAPRQAPT
ncbi:MAG TPA: GlsB/YeaQ/YmgE family stress response membrane protein, partial [Thermoanaerobaculia bacterium]|nr:GlsB/YeaQ/YmgE family stress response membrane protein [Thermoanaerobaculia bacterium]